MMMIPLCYGRFALHMSEVNSPGDYTGTVWGEICGSPRVEIPVATLWRVFYTIESVKVALDLLVLLYHESRQVFLPPEWRRRL